MPTAHEFLTDQGCYIHTHFDPDFDDGDAENGPVIGGCDEYDTYKGDSHTLILQHGILIDSELIDWGWERFCEEMEAQYGANYG